MCLVIYSLGSIMLLAYGGHCKLTWKKANDLLSAKLENIILVQDIMRKEQDVMKKDIKDLMTSMTAMNMHLSEVASINQKLTSVQEGLDNMDSHVKDVATAEVGRHTHLLRRGLKQEKAVAQSRFEKTMNNTSNLSARVDILDNKHDVIKSEMKQTSAKTGSQIAIVQQEVVATQRNTQTLQSRFDTFERTQSDLQSKTRSIATQVDTTRGQIATVQQEVVTTQRNTQTLQSRVDTIERTQSDLQSKTSSIATQVDTTRGHIATVQQEVVTTQRNTQTLQSRVDTIERTQSDLQSKANCIAKQVDTSRGQIATVQQEVVTTQRNTQTLKSRVDTMERTQSDLQSNASSIATQVDTTRGQIATVQQEVVTIQRNTRTLQSRVDTIERTQSDLQLKTRAIDTQVDTTRGQISRLQNVTGTFVGFSVQLKSTVWQPYYNKSTVIKSNAVNYNDGRHYNTSTGIFTVPVSGVYVFMFNVQVNYDSRDKERLADVALYVNGKYKASAIVQGVGILTGGNAAVVKVSTGDRVYVSTSIHRERYYINTGRTMFNGALLHVI